MKAAAPPVAACGPASSIVAVCRDEQVIKGLRVRRRFIRELVDETVKTTAGCKDLDLAWSKFVHPGQTILLKFAMPLGGELGTSLPMLEAMLESLEEVGHKRTDIRVADCPYAAHLPGLAPSPEGWSLATVPLSDEQEQLRRCLDGVHAIINVPFLSDHSLVGASCAMVNMSLPMIRRPGRRKGQDLHSTIVTVCASEEIRPRVKLTLVNALLGVFDGGPMVDERSTAYEYSLWGSTDMVAADRLALEWLDRARKIRSLPSLADQGRAPDFLAMAVDVGLGQNDLRWIDRRVVNR